MRKFFSLSQCFLFCLAILFSFKSFAVCPDPGSGITSSTTCTGIITTNGDYAHGIHLNNIMSGDGDIKTVNMIGDVTTSGNHARGIYLINSLGTNKTNTVNMTGNIETTGGGAYGIYLWNDTSGDSTNTVNITGNITTRGVSAYGIYLYNYYDGDSTNTVNMTGNIETTGGSTYGIFLDNRFGSNNTNNVNMAGNITTNLANAYGMILSNVNSSSSTNTVNMTGNITTRGFSAYGIHLTNIISDISSRNNINTVNMTGNITTSGVAASGIWLRNYTGTNSTSSTNTVNMRGNILTTGEAAHGIELSNSGTNDTNTVNMTGNILTNGDMAFGVSLLNSGTSNTNTVNMTGNITTTGDMAYGIFYLTVGTSNTNTVNMTGNITTTGVNAHGIGLLNSGTSITNTVNVTGNITTTGVNAHGIVLDIASPSSTNTVNIIGHISATGLNSNAIIAANGNSAGSNTVQLYKGSSVIGAIGDVNYTANNFLKLNLGAGASYSFATTGFTVQDLNGRPMVTGSAHAAGVGNVVTASQSLYERTSQITQSLDDRVRTYDSKQNTSQDFWINTYYSDSNRGGQGLSGSNLSFNQYRSGITAGFNVKNSYTPTELIVNYEHGKLNIDEGNQGISSNSVMAGALFPDIKKLLTGTLSAKAMVGYSDFSGDRKVLTNDVAFNGSRNVTASYQSSHLTIGSAWTKTLYQTDKMILDTLVGIDLNTQHINSYSESDLFKWSGRTINQLQERVTLGMEMKPFVKPLTLFGRVGVERRDLISGENQHYAINNTAVSYNDSNQRNTYATLNAGAYYPLTQTVKAYAQVRYYDSVKDIDSLSGSIGISGQF
jgi:hypothetical protein